jgi:hypothetical protein
VKEIPMSLGSFACGAVLGGGLVFGSLSYHVLRTDDGVQVVPKLSPTFVDTYLDVRTFGISDWARHKPLAAAIVHAKKENIFKGPAADTVSDGVNGLVSELTHLQHGG